MLQPDPIGYAGGMNLYAYVGNDPMNFSDPNGLMQNELFVGAPPVDSSLLGSTQSNVVYQGGQFGIFNSFDVRGDIPNSNGSFVRRTSVFTPILARQGLLGDFCTLSCIAFGGQVNGPFGLYNRGVGQIGLDISAKGYIVHLTFTGVAEGGALLFSASKAASRLLGQPANAQRAANGIARWVGPNGKFIEFANGNISLTSSNSLRRVRIDFVQDQGTVLGPHVHFEQRLYRSRAFEPVPEVPVHLYFSGG